MDKEENLTNREEKIKFCLDWIKRIQAENSFLDEKRNEALKFYRGDPDIVNVIEGRSKVTTSDLMDIVEWTKPALLEMFTGGSEVVSLQPTEASDVEIVRNQELLVNHQLKVKNKWYLVMHDWITDALLMKIGAVKYQWYTEKKYIEKSYEGLNELEYQAKLMEPNIEIISHEEIIKQEAIINELGIQVAPAIKEYNITVRYTIEDEYPLVEAIPPEEFGFPITARNIEDAPFVYHKVKLPKWKFIKLYGRGKLEEVQTSIDFEANLLNERFIDLGGISFLYDKDEYIVYECYYYDDEGEARLAVLCGDNLIIDEKNPYDKPPFQVITPLKMAHRVCGLSLYDLLKDIQRLRTELMRQIVDNLYQSNFRRYFGDPDRLNLDDFLNNNVTNALIRTRGSPQDVVMPEIKAPLPPEVFTFWEQLNIEKDYHSGIPRAYQGIQPAVAHKTFRGQNQQVRLASQRVDAIARIIAEMGVAPLITDIVNLNIKFLKKKTAVRYLNEWIEITPDNIVGKFDIAVNVGLGTSNKDNIVIQMQQLLGLYAQIFKAGLPIVTAQNAYNAMKEMVKAMGFKNTADFITDPDLSKSIMELIEIIKPYSQRVPELMPLLNRIASGMGMKDMSAKTFPGQETPAQPMPPGQPVNPVLTPSGGGFYA